MKQWLQPILFHKSLNWLRHMLRLIGRWLWKKKQQKRRSALLDELLAEDPGGALLPEDQANILIPQEFSKAIGRPFHHCLALSERCLFVLAPIRLHCFAGRVLEEPLPPQIALRGTYQRNGLKQRCIACHDDVEDIFEPPGNPGRAIRVVLPPPLQAGGNQVPKEIVHPILVSRNRIEADYVVNIPSGIKGDNPLSKSRILV